MKTLRFAFAALLGLFLLTSCDFYPVTLTIYAEDSQGHDILDPTSPYFVGYDGLYLYYDNVQYDVILPKGEEAVSTKVYAPQMFGLQLRKSDAGWYLYFGELDGAKDHNDAFALHWPDDSLDWIHYRRFLLMGIVDETWKLNGKRTSMPMTIVKTSAK